MSPLASRRSDPRPRRWPRPTGSTSASSTPARCTTSPTIPRPPGGAAAARLWGLPRDVSTFALYLNMDLINEAGAADPRELAASTASGTGMRSWTWPRRSRAGWRQQRLRDEPGGRYGMWLNAAGGGFFNEDRTACALELPRINHGSGVRPRPVRGRCRRAVRRRQRAAVPGRQGRHVPEWPLGDARRSPRSHSTGTWWSCPRVPAARPATGCSGARMR